MRLPTLFRLFYTWRRTTCPVHQLIRLALIDFPVDLAYLGRGVRGRLSFVRKRQVRSCVRSALDAAGITMSSSSFRERFDEPIEILCTHQELGRVRESGTVFRATRYADGRPVVFVEPTSSDAELRGLVMLIDGEIRPLGDWGAPGGIARSRALMREHAGSFGPEWVRRHDREVEAFLATRRAPATFAGAGLLLLPAVGVGGWVAVVLATALVVVAVLVLISARSGRPDSSKATAQVAPALVAPDARELAAKNDARLAAIAEVNARYTAASGVNVALFLGDLSSRLPYHFRTIDDVVLVFTAFSDWRSADDPFLAGEGLRALADEDQLEEALTVLANGRLMQAIEELCESSPRFWQEVVIPFNLVCGPMDYPDNGNIYVARDVWRGGLARSAVLASDWWSERFPRRVDSVPPRVIRRASARPHGAARRRGAGRPGGRRVSRATTRAGDSGDDGPGSSAGVAPQRGRAAS